MKLVDLFENLYRPLRLRGRSPRTSKLYHCTFRAFERGIGHEPTLADLDELVLAKYLELRVTQVSPHSAERERIALMALARLAWERRLLEVLPVCPPAPVPERIPTAWSIDDMKRLMALAEIPATYGKPGDLRRFGRTPEMFAKIIPAIVATVWDTGERIGALLECRADDFDRPTLMVKAEYRKGKKKAKLMKLSEETCDRIEVSIAAGDGTMLFPWPLTPGYLCTVFGRVVKAAGLERDDVARGQRFHQVRRTALSHFAALGGDATLMAGHSESKTTRRWYLDPRLTERGPKPCDVLPRLSGGVDGSSAEDAA
jgi:integrase